MRTFDRTHYGPSWIEVILGAVLSLLLGVVLAFNFYVFKPVTKVKEVPKDAPPGTVYYIEGSRDYSNARRLVAKQKFFAKGGSIVLNEDELNAAASPAAGPVQPTPAADASALDSIFIPGPPNFRIKDGMVQIAVPVHVKYSYLDQTILVQATGGFSKQSEGFVFVPKTMYVGSCAVERIPHAIEFVLKKFYATQPIPPEILASWSKLAEVTVEGTTLHLIMP